MVIREVDAIWKSLSGRRLEVVERFYEKLFEKHPHYREMFPAQLDAQMERMVEMLSAITRFADRIDVVRPYLLEVGHAHRRLNLGLDDLRNFRDVFVDTLDEVRPEGWTEARASAWRAAFDDVIIPIVEEGMGR